MDVDNLVGAARGALPDVLIALDFDGTLAPIVGNPQDSRPVEGALDALQALAARGARLAIVTGRDARTVLSLSGFDAVPGLVVEALYGAESWRDGELTTLDDPPVMHRLRQRLPQVLAAHNADARVWIEDKRLSLVVHGRLAADPASALEPLRAPITALAAELGLQVHAGRGVIELRLPGFDKAAALRRLVDGGAPAFVLFAGDDVGDVPAFAEIRALRAGGAAAWSVGVVSEDVPELAEAADVHLPGPPSVVGLLARIAARDDPADQTRASS